ncbi:autotransporter assembly complex protein TamB [Paraferrimonas sedimenticola]|uniref:DUF490 domain-containing protein n=1 Tax=Paraferrimonas sedimenticola TaxID=375674 RepID=A0AA37RWK8_9GAMM|nr:translocation/assembly module TamB domain-containing protein [Paraferrimonas sedimenticola]GLP96468.1 DUF490 domain-containing protein [Paraferrimonas sedimenticola]
MKRKLVWIASIPLVLLITLALLIGTSLGARLLIFAADKWVPGLTLEYQSGQLNSALQLKQLGWQSDGINLQASGVELQWRPGCLLQTRVCVNRLVSQSVTFELSETETSEPEVETESSEGFVLPIAIQLEHGQLDGVKLDVFGHNIGWQSLTLSALFDRSGLSVESLYLAQLHYYEPKPESDSEPNASEPAAASAQAVTPNPMASAATSTETDEAWALAQLPTIALPFPIELKQLVVDGGEYKVAGLEHKFERLSLGASWHGTQAQINQLSLVHPWANLNADAQAQLEHPYPLSLSLGGQLQEFDLMPDFNGQALQLEAQGSLADLTIALQASELYQLALTGQADLTQASIPFNANIDVDQAHWPTQKPEYQLQQGTISASGTVEQQEVELSGELVLPELARLKANLQAEHEIGRLQLSSIQLSGEQGELQASGWLDYQNGVAWDAELDAQQLLLSQIHQSLPDYISGQLNSSGHYRGEDWKVTLAQTDLEGRYLDIPFALEGDLDIDQSLRPKIPKLKLTAKDSVFEAQGEVNEQWDISATLNLAGLEQWHGDANGDLQLEFKVIGEEANPNVVFQGSSARVGFLEHQIEALSIKGFYFPLNEHDFRASLRSERWQLAGLQQYNLRLGLKGQLTEQFATLSSAGDLELALKLANRYDPDKQIVSGELYQTRLSYLIGPWAQQQPIEYQFDINNSIGEVSAHCWQHQHASLCLNEAVQLAQSGDAEIAFRGDVGALIEPLMPDNLDWRGNASLDAQAKWQPDLPPTAEIQLAFEPGAVTLTRQLEQEEKPISVTLDYQTLQAKASVSPEQVTSDLEFIAGDWLSLNADWALELEDPRPMRGELRLDRFDLSPLQPLLPNVTVLKGTSQANLQIGGNLTQPELQGEFELKDGAFANKLNPTDVDSLQLTAKFSGNELDLDSSFVVGDGPGSLNAELTWADASLQGDLNLTGDKLSVIYPPLAILKVSPNLDMSFGKEVIRLRGDIVVPEGKVELAELAEGGVQVSKDVIFVDAQGQGDTVAQALDLSAQININVGPEVSISGFGLTGKLAGALNFQQEPAKPPLLFGDIRINEGNYRFMGQRLSIPRGDLQFSGPPSLPNLNVEAVREIKSEDVTAGVRITGTAAKPEVDFFSNPSMEQAEILSYIVNGRGFNSSSGDDNSMLAAAALSVSGNVGVINNIGQQASNVAEKIGFNNVKVDTNDDGRVALSGYIGEDLMVKYGVGVLNAENQLTVRYFLFPKLYLESVSQSIEQTLDMYYSFDIGAPEPQ